MGKRERFLETSIDRTPYSSCFLVAGIGGIFLIIGVAILWQLAFSARKTGWFDWLGVNSVTSQNLNAQDLLNQAKNAGNSALEAGQNAVTNEINNQVNQQVNNLGQSLTNEVQNAASSAVSGAASSAANNAIQSLTSPSPSP